MERTQAGKPQDRTFRYPLPSILTNDLSYFPVNSDYLKPTIYLPADSAPLPRYIYPCRSPGLAAVGRHRLWIYGTPGGIEPASGNRRSIDPSQLSGLGTDFFY